MAKVVILGGSFGGLTAALEIKRLLGTTADITLLSDSDRFVFLPSLPWVAMGWRKAGDISIALSEILEPKGITFIYSAAKYVDPDKSVVRTTSGEINYDYLVISTGPHLAFEEIPGLGPDKGYSESLFTVQQAKKTNAAWNKLLENHGRVVIGSAQGVSCFGPAYEYAFEVDYALRKRGIRNKVPITYVTSEPYIGHFGIGGLRNSKRIMEDEFAKKDIKVITNQAIEEVTSDEVRLKDGTKLPFKLSMIIPAFKGAPAVSHLGNPRGFIPVDKNYRHTKYDNIFTIGVAIAIAPPEPTPVPTGVPKTGYMTQKMAKTAAAAIAAEIKNKPLPSPEELSVLCLMDMGNTAAFMKANPVLPPRQDSVLKEGIRFKLSKIWFEKYFMWKMRHGLSGLP
jgi:sulfide:quinone oxidoreductase